MTRRGRTTLTVVALLALLQGCAPLAARTTGDAGVQERWSPQPGATWQWQLSGELDLDVDVDVFDVDWETTTAEQVAELHDRGRGVVCYLSVGTVEEGRPDEASFPDEVIGERLPRWPDERWLDVRRLDVLAPVLEARLDVCAAKGFDAVEPDNVDAWRNDSGFPLTGEDQLAFNRWVAGAAHERGLGVALKNDLAQVDELVDDVDFAVVESCLRFDECDRLQPFLDAGKAVLHAEYDLDAATFRAATVPDGFSSILKRRELDAWRVAHGDDG